VFKKHLLPKDRNLPEDVPPRLPDEPDYSGGSYIAKDALVVHGTGIDPAPIELRMEDWRAVKSREYFLYVYGYIRYVGVGDSYYETRFCNVYWIPYGPFDPTGEGFRMADFATLIWPTCARLIWPTFID
jgi:hypothetical protein